MNNLYKKGELSDKDFCTDIIDCGKLKHKCSSKNCDHEAALVLFYASWCPHCVNFVDKWTELQSRENSKVFFRSYNAAIQPHFWSGKNNALVQGYPTIVKYKKKGNKFIVDETFSGNRGNIDELFRFVMKGISVEVAKTPKSSRSASSRGASRGASSRASSRVSSRASSRGASSRTRSKSKKRASSKSRLRTRLSKLPCNKCGK